MIDSSTRTVPTAALIARRALEIAAEERTAKSDLTSDDPETRAAAQGRLDQLAAERMVLAAGLAATDAARAAVLDALARARALAEREVRAADPELRARGRRRMEALANPRAPLRARIGSWWAIDDLDEDDERATRTSSGKAVVVRVA